MRTISYSVPLLASVLSTALLTVASCGVGGKASHAGTTASTEGSGGTDGNGGSGKTGGNTGGGGSVLANDGGTAGLEGNVCLGDNPPPECWVPTRRRSGSVFVKLRRS